MNDKPFVFRRNPLYELRFSRIPIEPPDETVLPGVIDTAIKDLEQAMTDDSPNRYELRKDARRHLRLMIWAALVDERIHRSTE